MSTLQRFRMSWRSAKFVIDAKLTSRARHLCFETLDDRECFAADMTLDVMTVDASVAGNNQSGRDLQPIVAFSETAIGETNVLNVKIRNVDAKSFSLGSFASTNSVFSIAGPLRSEVESSGVVNLALLFRPNSLDFVSSIVSFDTSEDGKSKFEFMVQGGGNASQLAGVAPRVESVQFGDGSSQRSMIEEIKILFDSEVVVDNNAFSLDVSSVDSVGTFNPVAFTIHQATSVVMGKSVVKLTFSGSGIVGNSLPDGNYRLTVLSSAIRSISDSLALDGDNNGTAGGNFIDGEAKVDDFFRLFGDSNGDGIVDGNSMTSPLEINRFRATIGRSVGDTLFNPLFDSNADGNITPADTNDFRRRVGKTRVF